MSEKITQAMQQVREKVGYVQKTGTNQHFKYSFAGDADFLRAIRPAMVEAGLLMLPEHEIVSLDEKTGNAYVRINYTLAHKDGDIWPFKVVSVGCGNDRTKDGRDGDKAIPKALTAAQKYALRHLFQIETGDDPEEDRKPEKAPEPDRDVANTCLQKIGEFTDLGALKAWWEKTKAMLPEYHIVNDMNHPGGPTYAAIVDAMKKRVLVLQHSAKPAEEPRPKADAGKPFDDDVPF